MVVISLLIISILVLLFLLFNKLKIKAKISIPIVLVFGLTFGGGGFGYLSAVHGSHFVVVLEDLTVEKYYSIGNNDYERADGEI